MAYFSSNSVEINLPLMALVDYRGFRVIAVCALPVDRSTIIYGSCDAGMTVHAKSKRFNAYMKDMAKDLNLKKHLAGWKKVKSLYAAADIEGHKGKDGKYYLLDFSRSMPPVDPKQSKNPPLNGHLYNLFRREFVKSYPKPLCSDGFSGFIRSDPEEEKHNEELAEATTYLYHTLIPAFAREFLQIYREAKQGHSLSDVKITENMHRRGINMRYLGKLYTSIQALDSDWALECSTVVLLEACARVVKNQLNLQLRHLVREHTFPADVPYRRLVVRFLNLVFGGDSDSRTCWREQLGPDLIRYFGFCSPDEVIYSYVYIYTLHFL